MTADALFGLPELPPEPDEKDGPGPVYQGVGKSIRYLAKLNADEHDPQGKDWQARMAGTIAQARSLAGSIDRESGRDPRRKQASGVSLASLHERLDALMLRLDPDGQAAEGPAEFDKLQAELAALEVEQRRRTMDGHP